MMKATIKQMRVRIFRSEYETTRWLVMTVAALGAFLGFQLIDSYLFGP